MSLTIIKAAVDHDAILKGDVVIIKRTFVRTKRTTPAGSSDQLITICTKCNELFPTSFRRMSRLHGDGKRRCEVRNIPCCPKCRGAYARDRKAKSNNAPSVAQQAEVTA